MESFGDDKFLLTMRILSWSTKNIDYYCQRLLLVLRVTLTLTLRLILILIRTSTTTAPPPTATTTIITIPSRRGQNMTRETIIYDFLLVKNAMYIFNIYLIYIYVCIFSFGYVYHVKIRDALSSLRWPTRKFLQRGHGGLLFLRRLMAELTERSAKILKVYRFFRQWLGS